MSELVGLPHSDTRSDLDSRSRVPWTFITGQKLDVAPVVQPHGQGAGAARLAQKAVARILDDEAQAGVAREVDSELDLRHCADIDRRYGVRTQRACRVLLGCFLRSREASPAFPLRHLELALMASLWVF